jgi:GT2 family glycosyltransferase
LAETDSRPPVDVVMPFAGSPAALARAAERLGAIEAGPEDTITIVDNRADPSSGTPAVQSPVRIVRAAERQSSYYARNRGASSGSGEWIVFLDADVQPAADLIALYFKQAVEDRTGVLAGSVVDERVSGADERSAAVRYALLRSWMSQSNTLASERWGYAQTANCAIRRTAFEEIGGFREQLRSGGDADICFRLREAGWSMDVRDEAAVVHDTRRTLRAMLRQRARHGSGAAWLERQYPGSFPRRSWPGLAKWTAISCGRAAGELVRGRRDQALVAVLDPVEKWAFELGRLAPNEVQPRDANGRARPRR